MKLKIKGERDKQLSYAFIALASLLLLSGVGNVLTGSLAWHFATTQKTVTTPMSFNQPFTSDASGADATGMTMFASAFIYWRLNVSPENVDNNQKMLLGFVPSVERDELKKALDIEAERIKKGGIPFMGPAGRAALSGVGRTGKKDAQVFRSMRRQRGTAPAGGR